MKVNWNQFFSGGQPGWRRGWIHSTSQPPFGVQRRNRRLPISATTLHFFLDISPKMAIDCISQKMSTKKSFTTSRYGWQPDLPDHRDQLYAAPLAAIGPVPAKMDLRGQCPPVYDQGQLGSCTANAIAAAIQFDRLKQKIPDFVPSRLFIYYNERAMENTVASDSGAQIRDGIKSVVAQGD